MPVDWIDFKELRQQLSIAQVLAHYKVSIRQKADQGSGFCPLPTHQPARGTQRKRSPSFSVNFAKNVWQCFGCGASGNVLDLACRLEGLDPGDGGQRPTGGPRTRPWVRTRHRTATASTEKDRSHRRRRSTQKRSAGARGRLLTGVGRRGEPPIGVSTMIPSPMSL
ncbi:MAG: hypothetical protein KatS3mg082_3158 [Nitrospiraceae bacterium]|nr:MAG: hypothetical protein KatS3mg082_3158 [Nitrospiraceae bacterium]